MIFTSPARPGGLNRSRAMIGKVWSRRFGGSYFGGQGMLRKNPICPKHTAATVPVTRVTVSKLNEQARAEGKSPLIPLSQKGETLGKPRFGIVSKLDFVQSWIAASDTYGCLHFTVAILFACRLLDLIFKKRPSYMPLAITPRLLNVQSRAKYTTAGLGGRARVR